MADVHFGPNAAAVLTLTREGILANNVHLTVNTSIDALLAMRARLALDAAAVAKLATRFASINRQWPMIVVTANGRGSFVTGLNAILEAVADPARLAEVVSPVHLNPVMSGLLHNRLDGVAGFMSCPR